MKPDRPTLVAGRLALPRLAAVRLVGALVAMVGLLLPPPALACAALPGGCPMMAAPADAVATAEPIVEAPTEAAASDQAERGHCDSMAMAIAPEPADPPPVASVPAPPACPGGDCAGSSGDDASSAPSGVPPALSCCTAATAPASLSAELPRTSDAPTALVAPRATLLPPPSGALLRPAPRSQPPPPSPGGLYLLNASFLL